MNLKYFVVLLYLTSTIFYCGNLDAYSTNVHQRVATRTVDQNTPNLNAYLTNIGLPGGIDQYINKKRVREWIEYGSWNEDYNWSLLNNPLYSHFYNPLSNTSGVGDLWFSAYDWANALINPWSWRTVRTHFYRGLTLTMEADREKSLANAFRGIGHIMHLVQDTAVPAHTRGDLHLPLLDPEPFEGYTNKNIMNLQYNSLSFPYWNISVSPGAPRQFWDLDSYNGSVPYGSGYIGLSEYTNANFASKDTIFSETLPVIDSHYFPYPRKSNALLYEEINPLTNKKTKYFKIVNESENIDHFAVAGRFYNIFEGLPNLQRLFISLDDSCHNDYQRKLIPRAVGYSAGLLDYFFRGSVDLTLPSGGYYAKTAPGQGFTTFSLLAKNTTSTGETMDDGTIELVVIYRLAYDDPFINYPPDYNFQAATEYSYIVVPEASGRRSIPRDTPVELTFDLSGNPIPLYAIDVNVQLVYHGRLGSEDGAVVVGLKDISEPTPVDILNDMDVVCLNGIWYPAGSQDAIDQVDSNQDGIPEWDIYAHNIENIYYKVSPSGNPVYASPSTYDSLTPSLNAGGFERALFILTEKNFNYSLYEAFLNADPRDPWGIQQPPASLYSGTSITNQTYYVNDAATCAPAPAPCHIWWYPTFLAYKNVEMWGGGGILYYNNAYPAGSECSCYEGLVRECPAQQMAQSTLSIESAKSQESGHGHVDLKSKKGYLRRAQQQGGPSGQAGRHPD